MKIKTIVDEAFGDFCTIGMLIAVPKCTTKCWARQGLPSSICQNDHLKEAATLDISDYKLIHRYFNNPNTECIIFSGLDAYDSKDEIVSFIDKFRQVSSDDIVIYTGRPMSEIEDFIEKLNKYSDIYIKTGIYIPNANSVVDKLTGVKLISDNQYFTGINLTQKCQHCKYKKSHSISKIYCTKKEEEIEKHSVSSCDVFERIGY